MWIVYAVAPDMESYQYHATPSEAEARSMFEWFKQQNWAVTLGKVIEDFPGWQGVE